MPELRQLERQLESARSLSEVVSAMRNMAAIYVRRAENTLDAMRPYAEVVERALRLAMRLSDAGQAYWRVYNSRWTRLNHVRTLCAALAAAFYLTAAMA